MELNPVTGLVLLSKATSVSDDKPSLADLDTDSDEEDGQGIDQTWGQIQEFDRGRGRGEASFDLKKNKLTNKLFFFMLDPNIYKQRNDSSQVNIFVKK